MYVCICAKAVRSPVSGFLCRLVSMFVCFYVCVFFVFFNTASTSGGVYVPCIDTHAGRVMQFAKLRLHPAFDFADSYRHRLVSRAGQIMSAALLLHRAQTISGQEAV